MHYGFIYTAQFSSTSVGTAAEDFFELLLPADACIVLHRVTISQESEEGDAADEQLMCSIRRVTGAPTSGMGGTTPTPIPFLLGSPASGVTAEANNTTQLTGGTNVVLWAEAWNIRAGWDYHPAPEDRVVFQPSERCLVESEETTADAILMTGTIQWEELT